MMCCCYEEWLIFLEHPAKGRGEGTIVYQWSKASYKTMSVRGVRQLKQLLVRYSDYDGSSKGIRYECIFLPMWSRQLSFFREWIRRDLVNLAKENPELSIKAELKRNAHPFLRGYYGKVENIPVYLYNTFVSSKRKRQDHIGAQFRAR